MAAIPLSGEEIQKSVSNSVLWITCMNSCWIATGLISFPILFPDTAVYVKLLSGAATGGIMIMPAFGALCSYHLIRTYLRPIITPELLWLISGLVFGIGIVLLGVVAGTYAD